jgi:hypothetical protein
MTTDSKTKDEMESLVNRLIRESANDPNYVSDLKSKISDVSSGDIPNKGGK